MYEKKKIFSNQMPEGGGYRKGKSHHRKAGTKAAVNSKKGGEVGNEKFRDLGKPADQKGKGYRRGPTWTTSKPVKARKKKKGEGPGKKNERHHIHWPRKAAQAEVQAAGKRRDPA